MISPTKIWRRQKTTVKQLGLTGTVVTWTKIFVPSSEYTSLAPFTVVLVELENKDKAFGQLVDFDIKDLKIGMRVKSVLRRVREVEREDVIPYGIKFRPTSA
ncbi:MAG TPA: OB-fold domain-containing protein [Patescibacteria group bacterium]|nr:OB-fold domain-containing protein [Patescibacteria group bacterium]